MRLIVLRTLALLLAITQLSCAAGVGLTPLPHSMPAARAALRPEYRVFYDSLQDYGDWILIEPFGYVFRPRVALNQWRPFGDGFWTPTDVYGWVWVSAEPFGWATYHYGDWVYDPFQSWVWAPGVEWSPAWVSWQSSGNYVGWAPRTPPGGGGAPVPGGLYTYVPANQLASTDLKSHVLSEDEVRSNVTAPESIRNMDQSDGVRFNRGPQLEWIERLSGPLQRARLQDVTPELPISGVTAEGPRAQPRDPAPKSDRLTEGIASVKRAGLETAREARAFTQRPGGRPTRISVVRPFGAPLRGASAPADSAPESRRLDRPNSAAPDSAR